MRSNSSNETQRGSLQLRLQYWYSPLLCGIGAMLSFYFASATFGVTTDETTPVLVFVAGVVLGWYFVKLDSRELAHYIGLRAFIPSLVMEELALVNRIGYAFAPNPDGEQYRNIIWKRIRLGSRYAVLCLKSARWPHGYVPEDVLITYLRRHFHLTTEVTVEGEFVKVFFLDYKKPWPIK